MMTGNIVFAPLIAWPVFWAIVALAVLTVGLSIWRRMAGWWLRALGAIALLIAIANPAYQSEERQELSDIVIAVIDRSASQQVSTRPDQTTEALETLRNRIARLPNTELREVIVGDGEGDAGTEAMTALTAALAEEPMSRIAGVFFLSDGRIHDMEMAPDVPAPVHLLQSGEPDDWDRRLVVSNAPAFAIIGEPVTLTLMIEDQGRAPASAFAPLTISIDGQEPLEFEIPLGQSIDLPITLPHGGMNVLEFRTPTVDGELTDRNNAAVIQMNGVRDRLRVLLVSGEPHPGERTWRNLLKSDSAVDLVHFTILRPPEKQDGVPVDEMSLIAFPTRELFQEKIEEFDLIIFDRYRRRGILPNSYFNNITNYVLNGGALLVSAGPEYGSADSIFRSGLGDILPGVPTSRVVEEPYLPTVTDIGERHPVTEGLEQFAGGTDTDTPWGRWLRQIDVNAAKNSTVVMSGINDRPLLMLGREGEGRVALIASDHSWLWDRGYEGGGPQLELLRRLAHWMMKEPELEEEALWADVSGQTLHITRRTLTEGVGNVTITKPDGTVETLTLNQTDPGRYELDYDAEQMGLYRLSEGDLTAVIGVGPAAPKEFEQTIATDEVIDPIQAATGGGTLEMSDGPFNLRAVDAGRLAAGSNWLGITPRGAYRTTSLTVTPLVPAWLFLMLAGLLILGAWLREGRR